MRAIFHCSSFPNLGTGLAIMHFLSESSLYMRLEPHQPHLWGTTFKLQLVLGSSYSCIQSIRVDHSGEDSPTGVWGRPHGRRLRPLVAREARLFFAPQARFS